MRSQLVIRIIASAAAAVAALAGPAVHAADGSTGDAPDFASPYMVNVGPAVPGAAWVRDSYQQHFDNAHSVGLGAAFIPVAWSDIEKAPGVYDFSGLDNVVAAAHADHLDLVLQVQTTGEWSVPTPAQVAASGGRRTNSAHPFPGPDTAAPMNIDAALPFWTALVQRYHPKGALADSLGWKDAWGVRYYEVENEPDFQPWPGHGWETVPKDYALYLADLHQAVRGIDPSVKLVGPTLSGVEDGSDSNPTVQSPINDTGLHWLRSLLSSDPATAEWASDQYRATVPAGAPVIGAGPSIDVYSYHCDFASGAFGALTARTDAVRNVITSFATQAAYPTTDQPHMWCSEGAATSYDTSSNSQKYRFAWAQMQFAIELLGAGAERVNFDLGVQGGDSGATWQADPIRPAAQALATYFPSGVGVAPADISSDAANPIAAYQWTNPNTGHTSTIVWALNQPSGSGTVGAPFTVRVPVSTPTAVVVNPVTWEQKVVTATGGAVSLTIDSEDPSPPWIVAEVS